MLFAAFWFWGCGIDRHIGSHCGKSCSHSRIGEEVFVVLLEAEIVVADGACLLHVSAKVLSVVKARSLGTRETFRFIGFRMPNVRETNVRLTVLTKRT